MKISDLIAELEEFDQDSDVLLEGPDHMTYPIFLVTQRRITPTPKKGDTEYEVIICSSN